jgi:hypothetical protein
MCFPFTKKLLEQMLSTVIASPSGTRNTHSSIDLVIIKWKQWKGIFACFKLFVYICIATGDSIVKISNAICPDPFFVYNDLRWEVVFRFVDSGGIVDYCLRFLFIILYS